MNIKIIAAFIQPTSITAAVGGELEGKTAETWARLGWKCGLKERSGQSDGMGGTKLDGLVNQLLVTSCSHCCYSRSF
jgi:hypothetical protein